MQTIWRIALVYGFVSLLLLILGIWNHLDTRREQRGKDCAAKAKKPESN